MKKVIIPEISDETDKIMKRLDKTPKNHKQTKYQTATTITKTICKQLLCFFLHLSFNWSKLSGCCSNFVLTTI